MALMLDRWVDRADRKPLALLIIFFVIVAVAGGSSRADVLGQSAVRAAAVALMIALVAMRVRINLTPYRPVVLILATCIVVILLQLMPLPPAIWTHLPGHAELVSATQAAGLPTPWRPVAIFPVGAVNALFSLLVPAAALLGIAALGPRGVRQLLPILVAWTVAHALLTLLQASGGWISNPFINDADRQSAGLFANRNHGALFLALGTVSVAYWGFGRRARSPRKMLLAAGLMVLLLLTNLVTGSRAGLIAEFVALLLGLGTTRLFESSGGKRSNWYRVAGIIGALVIVALICVLSFSLDRNVSLDRIMGLAASEDARVQAAPTVWHLIWSYFPVGSGAGSFDQAFRMAEPLRLLDTTYMNHAHDDWLEIPMEYGFAGAAIVVAALISVSRRAASAWRQRSSGSVVLPRLGSIIVLVIAGAALTDYAARTPIMMTILIIAGAWLCAPRLPGWSEQFALRGNARPL